LLSCDAMHDEGSTILLPAPNGTSVVSDARIPVRMADALMVLASAGRRGLWCTTTGLGAFGLPELQAHGVPMPIAADWASVMTALALRLLEAWVDALSCTTAPFVEIPALVDVTEGDVARAYGVEGRAAAPSATVRLKLDPHLVGDSFLTIWPPKGTSNGFHARVCRTVFGDHDHRSVT
jgi:hypothetical protein